MAGVEYPGIRRPPELSVAGDTADCWSRELDRTDHVGAGQQVTTT